MTDVTPDEIRRVSSYLTNVKNWPLMGLDVGRLADELEREQNQTQQDEELAQIAFSAYFGTASGQAWGKERDGFQAKWVTVARAVREAVEDRA